MSLDIADKVMADEYPVHNRDKQIESELRHLMPKLVKEFIAYMSQLPCITIESRMEKENNPKVIDQITAWLFKV